jgi:hypothetical protein
MLTLSTIATPVRGQQRITGAGTMPMRMPSAKADVLTRSYDIGRTGANTQESLLTPANVANGLRKLFSIDLTKPPVTNAAPPDDPRLEAQPLIVTDIKMSDGKIHDVIFIGTMNNNVWAFDANTGTKIWNAPASLGPPIKPPLTPGPGFPTRTSIDLWGINIH